ISGPQSIHILRGVRQQQDEPGRFSICSRQAAVVPAKIIKTARYVIMKLSENYPYKGVYEKCLV
ncbi:hypothetical protein, partial [Escherichia coli]|uniref:hypothetical protein n=1 Tax=Escherichia coli TaxID=562 RepID=UPI000934EB96